MRAIIDVRNASKEDLKRLAVKVNKEGRKWTNKQPFTVESIGKHEVLWIEDDGITYSNMEYAKSRNEHIIPIHAYLNKMELFDLLPGMVVEFNSGNRYLVTIINDEKIFTRPEGWMSSKSYYSDMTCKDDMNNSYSIHKVYEVTKPINLVHIFEDQFLNCIWTRNDEFVVTMQEIADKFGVSVKSLKIKR